MEKPAISILDAMSAPSAFGAAFPDLASWDRWRVFLSACYGLSMSEEDLAIFRHQTGLEGPDPSGYEEIYCVSGRRSGKSKIASLICAFEAVFGSAALQLGVGDKAYIFLIATNLAQAKICFAYIKSFLELSPELILRQTTEEIELKNGITVAVKPCSYRSGRGFQTACIVLDELAFFRDENSANPAEDVVISLLPGLMKDAKILGISSAYAKAGYLYEEFKAGWAKPSPVLIWRGTTKEMNPSFHTPLLQRLFRRDAVAARAEFDSEFRDDLATYISLEALKAAAVRQPVLANTKHSCTAFCDPSGGRSDAMTLAIAHTEGDKIVVDRVEERTAPFDPQVVVREFSDILKANRITRVISDRFGGVWVEDAFRKVGIQVEMSEMSKNDLYLNFSPLLAMGRVELVKNEKLLRQFAQLERRTASGGRDSIDHPVGCHDDLCNSCAGAVVMASLSRVWDIAEQEARMPQKSEHRVSGRDFITARARDEADLREDNEEIMREFLCGSRKLR
jgi:hypothetical protein